MRFLVFPILFLLSVSKVIALEQYTYKLADNFVPKATFSCKAGTNQNIHLILVKNKISKSFEILPLKLENKTLIHLNSIKGFNKLPTILSYHSNGNVLTLVAHTKTKDNEYHVIDFNLDSQEIKRSSFSVENDFKTVLVTQKNSLVIFYDGKLFKILKVKNSKEVDHINVSRSLKSKVFFEQLHLSFINAVNLDSFVAKGSIRRIKAYGFNNSLVITNDDLENGYSTVLKIPLNDGNFQNVEHIRYNTNIIKTKKLASYIYDDNFFQLVFDSKECILQIYDINTGTIKLHKLNANMIVNSSKSFKSFKNYINIAKRVGYSPTVTVNKTIDSNLLVRCSIVPSGAYSGNIQNGVFGGNVFDDRFNKGLMPNDGMRTFKRVSNRSGSSTSILSLKDYSNSFFEISLSSNFNDVINVYKTPIHEPIDRVMVKDQWEEYKDFILYKSHLFIGNTMFNFGYQTTTDEFNLFTTEIND